MDSTTHDVNIEKALAEHGCDWSFREAVSVGSIDTGMHSQSRFTMNDEQVIIYAEAMTRGDQFPPLILATAVGGRLRIIDGYHRTNAAILADIETVPSYVIKRITPAQEAALSAWANARHGLAPTLKERLYQAILLVDQGATKVAAARMTGVPEKMLGFEYRTQEALRRIDALGIKARELAKSSVQRLGAIRSEPVLRAAAQLVKDTGMAAPLVSELVSKVNEQASESGALNVIEEERRRNAVLIASTAGGRIPLPREVGRLARALDAVARIDPSPIMDAALSAAMKTKLRRKMQRALRVLDKVTKGAL